MFHFAGYPAGVRRALVVLRAKDNDWWAGHYGGKYSKPQLRFISPRLLPAAIKRHAKPRKLVAHEMNNAAYALA